MEKLQKVSFLTVLCFFVVSSIYAKGKPMTIEEGRVVAFDYTLTVDGEVVDSSEGKDPIKYTHGQGQIIPGLANALVGLSVGDEKNIEVNPQDAYGEVNPEAFREISKDKLPKEITPEVGMMLQMNVPQGPPLPVKIVEVKESSVVLDMNHPLAGKTLNFHVKIVDIK